jgi:hypothetical protein
MRGAWVAALIGAGLLGGCATPDLGPTPAELKARWEAQNVYPQDYKADLMAFMRTYLNDPTHVRNAGVTQPALKDVGQGAQRYVVCLRYNARDMDGKYPGPKDGAAIYVSAKLDRFVDVKLVVRELCKDAVYAPFPELGQLTR